MITVMRRYRKALQIGLLVVIAAFVASSVFVFGSSSLRGGDPADSVATVNGEVISGERYQRRYEEFISAYMATMRDRFSPEMAERMGVPQQVLQELVLETLIYQRARAERLDVNDEELNAQIHAIPNFQDNGRFSIRLYEEVLRRGNLTKATFEGDVRRRLTRIKVENIVRHGVKLTDAEIAQAFVHNREEVRAAWALVETAPIIAAVTATDAELATYLKDHAAEFRLPDRRRVQYVTLAPKDFTKPVTEAEVEKYYAEHSAEFELPRQAKAAHILVRVTETGGSAAEDRARTRAADIIRRAKAGEDFAKLAKEFSQDRASADSGGDLGFVGKGEMVPAFEEALFALKKGEVSPEPVRTPFGFHAIKVTDVRESGKQPLRDAAAKIRERLQTETAEQAARAKAQQVRTQLLNAPDFVAGAKGLGLSPVEVTISRRPRTEEPAPADSFEDTAFSLSRNGVSSPIRTPAGFIVLKTVEELPATVPALDAIREQVTASVKRLKADAAALARARAIAAEAATGDFTTIARKAMATVGETGRFSRAKPGDRLPGDVMVAALRVPVGAVTEPVKTPQGYYLLKVLERFSPDMTELAADREKLAQEVLGRKQTQAWQDWLAAAIAGAKVDTKASRLQSRRG